ncbi:hypothetical protein P8452_40411 [Trifolium repens]|nr:hypothetical protein P8452_40411 [Trifolium repens]
MRMGAAHQENYYKRRAASSYPLDSPVILKKRAVDIKECNQAASSCSIYRHLHALEMDVNKRPLSNYAETVQKEVTNQMREILVDWLVEVTEEFKLVSDTLYLAVSCVDRFLSIRPLNMKHLQLLGVSSILIASKQGDISPPHAQQLCFMTDNTYTVSEVIQMEKDIYASLNSDLGYPTSKTFLRIFMGADQTDFQHSSQQLEFLACYLLELCLLCSKCVKFLPSIAAASALFLSRFIIQPNHHPWNPMLQCQTGYKPPELQECVFAIHDMHSTITVCPLQAVREKYLQPKFTCVASLTAGEIPASYFEPIDE